MLALLFPPSLGHLAASARAELLSQWFLRYLGSEVDIRIAPNYQALHRAITEAEVDLAWAPPVICARAQRSALAIFKAVRGGRSMYSSALVVRDGEARSLDELRGSRAAWVDRLSTAGYLLPLACLRDAGHEPEDLLTEQTFVGSYGRALRAVLEREADVTAIYVHDSNQDAAQDTLIELVGGAASTRLCALEFTASSPSDGLIVLDRPAHSDNHLVVEQLKTLTDGSQHTLLLTILDADGLEPAHPGDYDALRAASP